MDSLTKTVTSVGELVAATHDSGVRRILVSGEITDAPPFRLAAGQHLVGATDGAAIVFHTGVDGLQLTTDNAVQNVRLQTSPEQRAVYNDTGVDTLGRIVLDQVTTVGQVQLLARDQVQSGHVSVNGLDIIAADALNRPEHPHKYGVDVRQGAFTLWNLQPNAETLLTAELVDISAGREQAPVNGSGVLISGAGDTGGRLQVSRLETGAVFADSRIPTGTADQITGGVFVAYGAHVDEVRNRGPVVTYGTNAMVLDNWGDVGQWIAEAEITSHGPSSIGFVNFGTIHTLRVERTIETFGRGARGFNAYDGVMDTAEFERIVTHADAGVGVQISRPVVRLIVHKGITTHGGVGQTLVKGVIVQLPAYGLSVQPGGVVDEVIIDHGGIVTKGDNVISLQVQGKIGALRVRDGIHAAGHGSDAAHVEGGSVSLEGLALTATDGCALRLKDATLTALRATTARGASGDVVVESNSQVITDARSVDELTGAFGNAFTVSGSATLQLHGERKHPMKRVRR